MHQIYSVLQKHLLFGLIFIAAASGNVLSINKGVIVHLFEWRWADVAKECEDFLAPLGFAGVQISPPSENIIVDSPPRPWWERYQPISYKLTTRSGTRDDLQDMLNRCNKVSVRIFADAVLNHMTGPAKVAVGTGGSSADPLSYSYPAVPYSRPDFHLPACGVNNYSDANNVRNCELLGLRDLDNSKPYVRRKQLEYLNKLIDMGFAGFRIDAAKHMWPADLKYMFDRLEELNTEHGFPPNTRPLIYLEVIDYGGGTEAVHWQDYSSLGLVTDFRLGNALGDTLLGGKHDLVWLKNIGTNGNLLPNDIGLVFVDNHDTQRQSNPNQLNYKTFRPYKMAIAFMLAYPWGTPNLLSSYYFDTPDQGPPHDGQYRTLSPQPITNNICSNKWVCEHRWRQVYNMVRFHNVVAGTEVNSWWDNGKNQIAFCRGNKGFIAFNRESFVLSKKLQTCLPKGKYCDVISGNLVNNKCTGKMVEVGDDGSGIVEINPFKLYAPNVDNDGVVALHIKAKIVDEKEEGDGDEHGNPGGTGSGSAGETNPSEGGKHSGGGKKPSGGNKKPSGDTKPPSSGGTSGKPSTGASGGTASGDGSGSPCEKLLKQLLASDDSSSLSTLLGQGNDDMALLRAVAKIRKMEKILDLLSLI